jgi:hypothetical protein
MNNVPTVIVIAKSIGGSPRAKEGVPGSLKENPAGASFTHADSARKQIAVPATNAFNSGFNHWPEKHSDSSHSDRKDHPAGKRGQGRGQPTDSPDSY